jgi:hypothetical protein
MAVRLAVMFNFFWKWKNNDLLAQCWVLGRVRSHTEWELENCWLRDCWNCILHQKLMHCIRGVMRHNHGTGSPFVFLLILSCWISSYAVQNPDTKTHFVVHGQTVEKGDWHDLPLRCLSSSDSRLFLHQLYWLWVVDSLRTSSLSTTCKLTRVSAADFLGFRRTWHLPVIQIWACSECCLIFPLHRQLFWLVPTSGHLPVIQIWALQWALFDISTSQPAVLICSNLNLMLCILLC